MGRNRPKDGRFRQTRPNFGHGRRKFCPTLAESGPGRCRPNVGRAWPIPGQSHGRNWQNLVKHQQTAIESEPKFLQVCPELVLGSKSTMFGPTSTKLCRDRPNLCQTCAEIGQSSAEFDPKRPIVAEFDPPWADLGAELSPNQAEPGRPWPNRSKSAEDTQVESYLAETALSQQTLAPRRSQPVLQEISGLKSTRKRGPLGGAGARAPAPARARVSRAEAAQLWSKQA